MFSNRFWSLLSARLLLQCVVVAVTIRFNIASSRVDHALPHEEASSRDPSSFALEGKWSEPFVPCCVDSTFAPAVRASRPRSAELFACSSGGYHKERGAARVLLFSLEVSLQTAADARKATEAGSGASLLKLYR
eukprot:TRINITY_DN49878_c0_g1_i1.p1 TRINITY_DN49878_c0_g1~~TRINITY_DN49878_c0_g1_i1.p1  ORF type:complete len:134 (+),score=0.76 TRINITY_DN49878_c0_g1_i1:173-574(+)